MVAVPPLSLIRVSDSSSRSSVGGLSLSVIVSVADSTPSDRAAAIPLTVSLSFGSSMSSFTGVRVKGAVPLCLFAAIVRGESPALRRSRYLTPPSRT